MRPILIALTSLGLTLGLAACAGDRAFQSSLGPSPGPATSLQPQVAEGLARPPYTPEQIRWSHPPETFTAMTIQGLGMADSVQETEWIESDLEGCKMRGVTVLADLTPVGEPSIDRATWRELRDHASFPALSTEITREIVRTEAGEFDAWKYEMELQPGVITRMWFDTATAGAPVAVTVEEDGEVVQRMSLIAHNRRAL